MAHRPKKRQTWGHQIRRGHLCPGPDRSLLILHRLYCTNLPEKINKNELKRALYMLFSTYGPVLDIVTRRMKMRGQAHVVYRDIQTSTQAMRALQGFDFFGKEMVGGNEI